MLSRVPKYCHIARSFGGNAAEARRQLKVWQHSSNVGAGWTVHLYHSKTKGWAIVMCSPDYKRKRR